MLEAIWNMFDQAGLMPHGVCFLWRQDLVYLHLFSDIAVTLAYFSLPAFLLILVRKKPELKKAGVIPLFALFILLCGLTHASNIWVLFVPDYLAQGFIKGLTAIVSIITAVMVWPLLPKLVAMPSTQELIDANERLRREIDSRKKAEEHSRKVTEALMELDDAVVVFDTDDRAVVANGAWKRMSMFLTDGTGVGLYFEEIVRKAVADGLVPDAIGKEEEWIQTRLEAHRNPGAPREVTFTTGKTFRMQERRLPSGGSILIGADVTKEKQWEESSRRSQRLESVGQLTGGIAHDFNNLLAIISGNLELMRHHVIENEKLSKRVESAKAATDRGAILVRKLLNFSRNDDFIMEATNINNVLCDLEDILEKSLTNEIDVQVSLSADLWLTKADPGDLGDAIINMSINARDAMPAGGQLIIETKNKTISGVQLTDQASVPPGDYVVLSISDTGSGIAREHLERIFEPFYSTKDESHGTGLGLSMVYGFVKRCNGEIRVYSEVGAGTTIRLYLPRAIGQSESVDESEPQTATRGAARDETLLVVDDEVALLDVIEIALDDLGYKVITATNGAEAVKILESNQDISLMLSDVIMPGGMDGFALAERAAEIRPGMQIILASGFTGKHGIGKLPPGIVSKRVSKPYEISAIAEAIRESIDAGVKAAPPMRDPPLPEQKTEAPRWVAPGSTARAI